MIFHDIFLYKIISSETTSSFQPCPFYLQAAIEISSWAPMWASLWVSVSTTGCLADGYPRGLAMELSSSEYLVDFLENPITLDENWGYTCFWTPPNGGLEPEKSLN